MRTFWRIGKDRGFTALAYVCVALLVLMLLLVLAPMLLRGGRAVFFQGTVEFRRMQFALFGRGDLQALQAELREAHNARNEMYALLDRFKKGIDTESLIDRAKSIYREYGRELQYRDVDKQQYSLLRSQSKDLRDLLIAAYGSADRQQIHSLLDQLLQAKTDSAFQGTPIAEYFTMAESYRTIADSVDLSHREKYQASLAEVQQQILLLFGPRPEDPQPPLAQDRYGMTRLDMARQAMHHLVYAETWQESAPGKPLVKITVPRAQTQFQGTELEPLFALVQKNLDVALRPRFTVYWQYFIDDSTPGHYFGGIGPEIIGTLLLTFFSVLFAVPLGIVSAAYLVECAGDNLLVKIIRTCINTLAGVPSIVFGLFGLAFFVLYLFPRVGLDSKACILSASLTLALLILPVIIRASEEAIRTVPQTYKEASLALGAGRFRTFLTVILPAAMPGILTGVILSLSRAAGETAPILFAGAVALGPVPRSILDPTRALSYGSYDIAVGDRLAMLVPHNQYGMIMALIALVLLLNIAAILLRIRMSRKLRGY